MKQRLCINQVNKYHSLIDWLLFNVKLRGFQLYSWPEHVYRQNNIQKMDEGNNGSKCS